MGDPRLPRAVRDLVAERRLVTLTGAPGVGKSRLAREALGDRPHVVALECSGLADETALADALCRALGVSGRSAADEEGIPRALRGRGVDAVLLDDFEHLSDAAGPRVVRWSEGSGCAFVLTSRRALRVATERQVVVEPLSIEGGERMSDAARLFVARARAVRDGYAPGPRELADIERIVRSLDGVPLAIELAAARMRSVGTAELVRALSSPLALSGARRSDDGRATLQGAIAVSWSLLSEHERDALTQLSVFRSGFTIEAAEAVVDLSHLADPPFLMDVVQALVDHSLLRSGLSHRELPDTRFTMLASVRAFAAERRRAADGAIERHRDWLLRHAEAQADALEAEDGQAAAARIDAVHSDLEMGARDAPSAPERARFALVIAARASARGADGHWLPLLRRAREALPIDDDALHAQLALAIGRAAAAGGRHREADRALGEASERARTAGLPRIEGWARLHRASACWRLGDVAGCEAHGREASRIGRDVDDPSLRAAALRILSGALMHRGELAPAQRSLEEARAILMGIGHRRSLGITLDRLGAVHQMAGHRDAARRSWAEALTHHEATGNRAWEAVTRTYLAELAIEVGDDDAAEAQLARAVAAHRESGDAVTGAALGVQRGLLALIRGTPQEAHERFDDSVALAMAGEHRMHAHLAMAYRGVARLALDRPDEGVADLEVATRFFEQVDNAMLVRLFGGWERAARVLAGLDVAGPPRSDDALSVLLARFEGLRETGTAAPRGDAAQRRALARSLEPNASTEGPVDVRVAAAVFRACASNVRSGAGAALEIDPEGRWFRPPGRARVSLERSAVLRRVVRALRTARRESPGASVRAEDLIAAGWPDERILEDAARIRLRVALSKLRKLGLAGVLLTRPGRGYLLDADVPLLE